MFFVCFITFSCSLNVLINGSPFSGDSYDDVLTSYGSDISTIISIKVTDGIFPLNSLSTKYSALETLEIASDFFTGAINSYLFQGLTSIKNVIINGATSIGYQSFLNCLQLETAEFKSCVSIDSEAFKGCSKLSSINMPNLTSLGFNAFENTNLQIVELNSLTDLTGFNGGNQFAGCSKLTHITMKSLTYISQIMFSGCSELIYIDAPLINSIKLRAFENCVSLNNITFPVLTSIDGSAFEYVTALTELNIPTVTTIGSDAFQGCTNLLTAEFKSCVSIGNGAFIGCSKLSSINMPNLTSLGYNAFENTNLQIVELNSLTDLTGFNGGNQFAGCSKLTHITMKSLTYISQIMFSGCSELIYIDAPLISYISHRAFENCISLNNITFPVLTSIDGSAFQYNTALTELNIPTVTTIDSEAFQGCTNLLTVNLDNCIRIGNSAFDDCTNLGSINIPKLASLGYCGFQRTSLLHVELDLLAEYSEAGSLGYYFGHCHNLVYVSLKSTPRIPQRMFEDCPRLQIIDLPSCTNMGIECFEGCNSITTVTLGYSSITFDQIPNPNGIQEISFPNVLNVNNALKDNVGLVTCKLHKASVIEASAFEGCINLVNLEIPNAIEFVGDRTFYKCGKLKSLLLKNLKTVNPESFSIFQECTSLQMISFPSNPPKTFHKDTFKGLNLNFFIPADSINIYDSDTSIEGDVADDSKWCGISLKQIDPIKVIADEKEGEDVTLISACTSLCLDVKNIKSLQIISGLITQEELKNINSKFKSLTELIINEDVRIENEIIPSNFLKNHASIKTISINCQVKVIEESAFEGCLELESIRCKNAKELKSDCLKGPTKLSVISFDLVETLTGSQFFSENPLLETIELPKLVTVDASGSISMNSPLLSTIKLPFEPPTCANGFTFDVSPLLIGVSNEAAIKYDEADSMKNDNKFYSVKLSYVLVICIVDGERLGGLNLKSVIFEGAQNIEVIEGTITATDFPLPSTVVSLSINEDVVVNEIPKNAMYQLTNLKTVNIRSKNSFDIGEEAFSGCSSLEEVEIKGAKTINDRIFNECSKLKTISLDNVQTIIGNSHFNGCTELISLSLKSLTTIPSDSSKIFLMCDKLSLLSLPSTPPKTCNKELFTGLKNQIVLSLPNENDYKTYDDDISVEGDVASDSLWCGLILPISAIQIRLNNQNKITNGISISDCISSSNLDESLITSLEIIKGSIQISTLIATIKTLPILETLIVSSFVKFEGSFEDGCFSQLKLVSITLPSMNSIPPNCFKNCINLKNVVLNNAKTIDDSAFDGCTSLESINLEVETFVGDSQFANCKSLQSVSLLKLKNVNSESSNIFSGCKLTSIYLPSTPPSTFHKDTFKDMNNLVICGLTNEVLIKNYDNNVEVEDDVADDAKWCGIGLVQLYIYVSVNGNDAVRANTIAQAIELSKNPTVDSNENENIDSIEIVNGMVKRSHLNELKNLKIEKFSINETATLESPTLASEQFKDITSLVQIRIMHDVILMSNCFSGCTSLESVEFLSVSVIYESCFKDCRSLTYLSFPSCKELSGDYIFAGCTSLTTLELPSLEKVDNFASHLFEGCTQFQSITLPSKEPTTFNEEVFKEHASLTVELPFKVDYLYYDDRSKVKNDIKEDMKWCGITINEERFPPKVKISINGQEIETRNLRWLADDGLPASSTLLEETAIETIVLNDGLLDANDLKYVVSGCTTLQRFEAKMYTLNEIVPGTFYNCVSLKEIVIEPDLVLGYGALQYLPNLEKLELRMIEIIRSNEFFGDTKLKSVSIPNALLIPDNVFLDFQELHTVNMNHATVMYQGCFRNCISLVNLELLNINTIEGDSHFEGCNKLAKLNLEKLANVDNQYSNIFKDCSSLTEIKLGNKPPETFNENIFKNMGKIPTITIPSKDGWNNYLPQLTVNDQGYYIWYGFNTGILKSDVSSCPVECETCPTVPECPECPEPAGNGKKKESKVAIIFSVVFGIITVILVIAIVLICLKMRKSGNDSANENSEGGTAVSL